MASKTSPASFLRTTLQSNPFHAAPGLAKLAVPVLSLAASLTGVLSAQSPAKPPAQSDPIDDPKPSDYLERHHASRNIVQLKRVVELDIRRLGILVKYLGKEVDGSDKEYSDIAAIYRKAVESYYGGDPLEAYRHLMASHARALDLYRKFSEMYRKKTIELATEITQTIAAMETDTQNATAFYELAEASHRLAIVRNQIKLGDEMLRFRRPDQAITQYKNARLMTILTSYHLEQDGNKRKEILQKHEADLKELGFNRSSLVDEVMIDQSTAPTKTPSPQTPAPAPAGK